MSSSTTSPLSPPPAVHLSTQHPKSWDSTSTLATGSPISLQPPTIPPLAENTSQHHTVNVRGTSEIPPPYDLETGLPEYSPPELSRAGSILKRLFWFGFLFPPLWAIGASTLLFTSKPPSQSLTLRWLSNKGDAEISAWRAREAAETETLWARRCTWVLAIFVCVIVTIAAAVWGEHEVAARPDQI